MKRLPPAPRSTCKHHHLLPTPSAADHHHPPSPCSHQLRTTPREAETIDLSDTNTYITYPPSPQTPLHDNILSPPSSTFTCAFTSPSPSPFHSATFTPTSSSNLKHLAPRLRTTVPSLARLPETPTRSATTPESHEPCRVPCPVQFCTSPLRLCTTPPLHVSAFPKIPRRYGVQLWQWRRPRTSRRGPTTTFSSSLREYVGCGLNHIATVVIHPTSDYRIGSESRRITIPVRPEPPLLVSLSLALCSLHELV
jgi:hypothetical protein